MSGLLADVRCGCSEVRRSPTATRLQTVGDHVRLVGIDAPASVLVRSDVRAQADDLCCGVPFGPRVDGGINRSLKRREPGDAGPFTVVDFAQLKPQIRIGVAGLQREVIDENGNVAGPSQSMASTVPPCETHCATVISVACEERWASADQVFDQGIGNLLHDLASVIKAVCDDQDTIAVFICIDRAVEHRRCSSCSAPTVPVAHTRHYPATPAPIPGDMP
jgi:hypothetical protein